MAEEKPRTLKVLEELFKLTEPTSPADIGVIIEVSPRDTGKTLYDLGKAGLARKPDENQSLWLITEKGRKYIENPPVPSDHPLKPTLEPTTQTEEEEVIETVPSQADLFKSIGNKLGVGGRKGDVRLDAIVYYVQRTANLDNLTSIWNALTEMGVANDVKKRWIKLYAQNLPDQHIPEELKEKLELGQETEKVKVAGASEIEPKPKRFYVVNNQIIGDPEGDYNFKEALQLVAQQKGASPEEANLLAINLAKMGPDMMTSMLGALTPLITKEPPKQDNTIIQVLQQRIEQLADDRHKAEMDALRTEMRSGQRAPEADQQIQTLSQQLSELRDELHKQELTRIQEQNQAMYTQLAGNINRLEKELLAASQGKAVESKYGLMSAGLSGILGELKGTRQDLKEFGKPLAQNIFTKGSQTRERTTEERRDFGEGLEKGIEREKQTRAMEDVLFFGKSS